MLKKLKHTDQPQSERGQGFCHELSLRRDWEEALDVLHFMLLKKWYYVGIATNTKRGFLNKTMKFGLAMDRKRTRVPEELQNLLSINVTNLTKLGSKIKKKSSVSGNNKDVWHFTAKWEEFPEGTKVIEVKQSMLSSVLKSSKKYRRGYIILDGQCKTSDMNIALLLMTRVFTNKEYCKKILAEVSKMKKQKEVVREPKVIKANKVKNREDIRTPSNMIMLLKEIPGKITTIVPDEKDVLLDYFRRLKRSESFTEAHSIIEKRLNQLFGDPE